MILDSSIIIDKDEIKRIIFDDEQFDIVIQFVSSIPRELWDKIMTTKIEETKYQIISYDGFENAIGIVGK